MDFQMQPQYREEFMRNPQERCEAEGNCPPTRAAREYWIAGLALASGAALGAITMYFYDPNRGRTRRARLQEKAASAARRTSHEVAGKTADLLNRAKGVAARAGASFACCEEVEDDVLAGRVQSHMGHVTRHVHAVEAEVKDGIVTLEGTLPDEERQRLIGELGRIPGVRKVLDRIATGAPA
jgi:hypothetical protein